ncbi:hypothetical protein BDF14DRAFT_1214716 [Spinellus fusiger]|nr:hypothetical protein BDF14DRAFT_1214716 [Spinellus fusiger]
MENASMEDAEDDFSTIEAPSLETEKSHEQILDGLLARVGYGRFQKKLLILCGFGWLADNVSIYHLLSISCWFYYKGTQLYSLFLIRCGYRLWLLFFLECKSTIVYPISGWACFLAHCSLE